MTLLVACTVDRSKAYQRFCDHGRNLAWVNSKFLQFEKIFERGNQVLNINLVSLKISYESFKESTNANLKKGHPPFRIYFHYDVNIGCKMLHEIRLALEKYQANQILCNKFYVTIFDFFELFQFSPHQMLVIVPV